MLRNLIAPYESRSWAQTNWILVRIWKVCKEDNWVHTFPIFHRKLSNNMRGVS